MRFVYLHIIWFAAWIGFRVEPYPFGLLTMIVSLEAIFLSTFVMISQNRADEKRQALADHQWQTVQEEEQQQNEDLLQVSNQILELTRATHAMTAARAPARPNRTAASRRAGRWCCHPLLHPATGTGIDQSHSGTAVACAELSPRPALSTLAPSCGHPRWSHGPARPAKPDRLGPASASDPSRQW
jgi:hypothetical protein